MGVASAKKRRKLREWTPLPEIRRIAVDPVLALTSAKRVPRRANLP
jgi:hypothetical protein